MVPDEKLEGHPKGTMNVCARRHSNASSSCENISRNAKNVNLIVGLKQQSVGLIFWGLWMSI